MFSTQLFSHNLKINEALKTICVKGYVDLFNKSLVNIPITIQ